MPRKLQVLPAGSSVVLIAVYPCLAQRPGRTAGPAIFRIVPVIGKTMIRFVVPVVAGAYIARVSG